ncbi:cytochrome P450 [Lophiotrema nucula]|uniref:Cytochrome P450 n=1 Tax=Lophiotrema nucula TaxID=690887 RepID=A0A6A5ZAL2_9PLEO|nr:cytochrome P450 [Lophiotrema nucula]
MSPSLVKQVLSVQAPVDHEQLAASFMKRVFGDKGAVAATDPSVVFGQMHKIKNQLNRDPFVSRAGDMVASLAEANIFSLVSPLPTQQNWQRFANISPSTTHGFEAEASFFELIRHFVSDMVLPSLFGSAFTRNFPDCAADLFKFDDNFYLFMMGIPSWIPYSSLGESIDARERVKEAMGELHDAVAAVARGEAPPGGHGGRWADLSDVSNVMENRVRGWEEVGGLREAVIATHALLAWVALVNANVVIFWLLFHIYSDAELLRTIRAEIAPFAKVEVEGAKDSSGAQPRLKIDSAGLRKRAVLLQSAMLEVMRLYTLSTSFKNIKEDFLVTESGIDEVVREHGARFTSTKDEGSPCRPGRTYKLRKGDMLCVPMGLHQHDPRYWKDAKRFDAGRFLIQKESLASDAEGTKPPPMLSVDYSRIHAWGVGITMCKGQKFSHREVLDIAAAFLTCWDFEPADPKSGWDHPGMKPSSGTGTPKAEVRVKLRKVVS